MGKETSKKHWAAGTLGQNSSLNHAHTQRVGPDHPSLKTILISSCDLPMHDLQMESQWSVKFTIPSQLAEGVKLENLLSLWERHRSSVQAPVGDLRSTEPRTEIGPPPRRR